MKLNHLIYTLMLGTALGTSSCSWLDLEPATAVSPSILGQGEVEQLLTGTYRSLQNDPGRDTWVLFDMRGENLINTYLSGSNDKEAVSGSFCGVTQNTCSTGTIRVPSLQKWMKRSIIFM